MTAPVLLPRDPGTFQISEPRVDDDFTQVVVEVAREMDARRSWHEQIRDAVAAVRLFLAIVKHHLLRQGR